MMKQTENRIKNQGFSLLTVIVSVSFIGILGLLILYIALSNFNMKVTDMKGKDSFYTAEQALEEIRTGLQEDVGEAMSEAYIQVLETYSQDAKTTTDATLDQLRQSEFKELFVKKLAARLQGTAVDQYNIDKLNGYLDMNKDKSKDRKFDPDKEILYVTNPSGTQPLMKKDMQNGIVLKNLKAVYVDEVGHAAVIETDIRLGIPKIQFPTPSTLPDLMNMIVVANKGIICKGGSVTDETAIEGSVYAGLLDQYKTTANINASDGSDCVSVDIKDGAKLTVSQGDKFVCQGSINIGKQGQFSCGSSTALWAQGINLSSATVELLGKTYLADDLTVQSGSGSKVTIRGEYYGFGNPDASNPDASKPDAVSNMINYNWVEDTTAITPLYNEKDRTASALNSSIVINGKNTTMDLSGVQKLLLAGKSYIASSKVPSVSGKTNSKDVVTGESLSVKGAQLAYLVPSELLGDGQQTNPMTYEQYMNLTATNGNIKFQMDTPVAEWGNKTLRQAGVNTNTPVQEVFYNDNTAGDGGYVYFYLNFTDSSKASAFMQYYYSKSNVNPETSKGTDASSLETMKDKMDKYFNFYFGPNSGVTVNDPKTYTRYITKGNVLSYNGGNQTGTLNNATDTQTGSQLIEEELKYQNMWYALNRKMIISYELLNEKVMDPENKERVDHNEREADRSVFDNLVNEKGLKNFIATKGSTTHGYKEYRFNAGAENGNLTAIMADNAPVESTTETTTSVDRTLTITSNEAANLRLVLCTGDVRIASGVTFNGIIMAKGKIILESGAKLISAPLEAAKVFQAQSNTDNVSPKNFFWEGDKYVLGNTQATEGSSAAAGKLSNTYDLAECVTYENWKKK